MADPLDYQGETLNEVLVKLGLEIKTTEYANGVRSKTVLQDGEPIRFPEGTLVNKYYYVTSLVHTTADVVWDWLDETGQVRGLSRGG